MESEMMELKDSCLDRLERWVAVVNKSPAFFLPPKSIRAMICFGTMTLVGILVIQQKTVPDWLVLWAGLIVKSYFDVKDE